MTTTSTGIAATTPDRQAEDRVDAASRYVHAAEGQLHTARASGVQSWQAAAAQTLHAALEEYLAAQAARGHRHAVPLTEAHRPGWKVEDGPRTYLVWAPRPEVDTAPPWAAHPCDHPAEPSGRPAGTARTAAAVTSGARQPSTPRSPRRPPTSRPRSARR
jgi:hypothetical protein